MSNIREEKGYTYGIGSFNVSLPQRSYWSITTEVNNEYTEATIEEIFKEIHKLRTETVPAEELNLVKNYLYGDLLRELDGVFACLLYTSPASNIEPALWLESDRMAGLNLSPSSLDIQKHVVIEEFKQRYLNNPYGDLWLKLRPLAYKVHPYRWATIGVSPEHIERATLEDVGAFFRQFYAPDNAIVSICGNIAEDKALELRCV